MPCFHHQLAIPMPGKTRNGKTPYKFVGKASNYWTRYKGVQGLKIMPCRQCIGCRLERSRQWATRLMHETKFHSGAIFLTLTYSDEMLPKNRSLNPSDLTTFIKDLRARNDYYGKEKIKYFAVGEYGDATNRPHYHLALFGSYDCRSPESIPEEPARSGDRQFSHPDFSAVWDKGLHRYSELTFESAAYVARYCLKKISGAKQETHYGERVPEFQRNSNGLGKGHFDAWKNDIYPSDQVVLPGRGAFLPPPYYDRLLEKVDPALFAQVKKRRIEEQEKITTKSEFHAFVNEALREGEVRKLVTEQTLIRSM
ncbi:MAG: hypothetical protein QXT77_08790 [Candidatus Methanomethylicaceae archaeon]